MKDPLADVEMRAGQAFAIPILTIALYVAAFVVFPGARGVLLLILGIVVTIMLHEFGHFVAAKKAGMKVTEFFLGFGPRLWSFRRGETEYGIKAIPAGGYVRIIGMSNLEDVDEADEPRAFRNASYKDKMCVAVAGVAVNLAIFMLCVFVVLTAQGTGSTTLQAESVTPGSPAATAGLESGDWIVSLDGTPVSSWDGLRSFIGARAGQTVTVGVAEGGSNRALTVPKNALSDGSLAIDATGAVKKVAAGSAAASAGFKPGDQLIAVAGDYTTNPQKVGAKNASGSVSVRVLQGANARTVSVVPAASTDENGKSVGRVGVVAGFAYQPQGVLQAAGNSVKAVGVGTQQVVLAIGKIFSPSGIANHAKAVVNGEPKSSAPAGGGVSSAEANRPRSVIGIVSVGSGLVNKDFWAFFALMASLNLFLALFNLIPLLPFDGGHLVVATYEAIASKITYKRVQVDYRKLLPITTAVTAVLILFGVSVMFRDLRDLL